MIFRFLVSISLYCSALLSVRRWVGSGLRRMSPVLIQSWRRAMVRIRGKRGGFRSEKKWVFVLMGRRVW